MLKNKDDTMKENKVDVIKCIQLNFNSLSKGQKLIASYINNHYEKAAFMTASKLGDTVGVSESTVVRFAMVLGFEGYPSLQKALQQLIKSKLTTVQRLTMDENLSDTSILLKKTLTSDIDNIRVTLDEIDFETFSKVIDAICGAKRIYILGLRSSSALAEYLGFYLNMILDNVNVVTYGMSDIFEQLLKVNEKDLLIGISYPRYSRKTLEALKYVKKQNCKVVGITDSLISPISSLSDYTLVAKSNMASFVDSLVAPMSIINTIIVAIGMREKAEITNYFTKLENIWQEFNVYDSTDKTE